MQWHRSDPVQEVDALFLAGPDSSELLHAALARRPSLYAAASIVQGRNWSALFAAPMSGEREVVLPHLPGTTALYSAAPGWWFPVGAALAVPEHVHADLLAALAEREGIDPPIIAVPCFAGDTATTANLYLASETARVENLDW